MILNITYVKTLLTLDLFGRKIYNVNDIFIDFLHPCRSTSYKWCTIAIGQKAPNQLFFEVGTIF